MGKIILEFDSIEEKEDARDALDGPRWKLVVWDIDQKLREITKSGLLSKSISFWMCAWIVFIVAFPGGYSLIVRVPGSSFTAFSTSALKLLITLTALLAK